MMLSFQSKFKNMISNYGIIETIIRIITKPIRLLIFFLLHKLNNYNYIFIYDSLITTSSIPNDLVIKQYNKIDDISTDLIEKLIISYGEKSVNTDLLYVKEKGCTLWIAFLKNDITCMRLSRIGSAIPKWFLPLNPNDQVFLRGKTVEKHRGKGISPALLQYMISKLSDKKINIYVDCSIYNKANIRSLPKAGFKIIAKMKPIKE